MLPEDRLEMPMTRPHRSGPTTKAIEVSTPRESTRPGSAVVFDLEEVPGGTNLTITESGFDKIPLARRKLVL